jgi:hypothetical protein
VQLPLAEAPLPSHTNPSTDSQKRPPPRAGLSLFRAFSKQRYGPVTVWCAPQQASFLRGCRRQLILRVACCTLRAIPRVLFSFCLVALSRCDKAPPRPLFALQSSSILPADLVGTAASAGLSTENFVRWHVIHSHSHSVRIYAGGLAVLLLSTLLYDSI